jgi:hypothetical protein
MLRPPRDAEEITAALSRLNNASELLQSALNILDATPVVTDADAFVDHALHAIADAIDNVRQGRNVFHA